MADDDGRVLRPTNGVIQIVPPTLFTFPSSGALVVDTQLVRWVPTTSWVSGVLNVRVHAAVTLTGGQTFSIVAQKASRSPEEPQTIFTTATGETIGTVSTGAPAGALVVTALNTPVGAGLRILLRANQTTAVAMAALLSAELVGRIG